MLTPQYLDRLPRKLAGLYAELEDAIISDIARRIVKADYLTPTAKWQIYKAKQLRLSNGEIAKLIQQKTGKSRQEIAKLMRTACFDALDPETKLYQRAGKKTEQFFRSEQFDKLIKAGIKNTDGLLKNFTRTTAKSADRALERLLDRAYMQMLSGAWSPQEVIAKTVRELADKGIQKIAYPSGHVDQADVAVRRALMTSVNQTSMQLSWAYADEMDCDLVEVTAHGGARPEHAKWQGRIFSRSGKHPVYPDFRKSTGYGTGEGLGGWNCRHSFHAYIEGFPRAYTDAHLKKLDDKTVSYNGKQYTEYEASQKQRKFERGIRDTKRQLAAYDSAIKASADDALTADLQDAFTRQSVKLKSQEAKMRDFLRRTNRLEDSARTQAVGFSKSVSQKTVWANKNTVAKSAESGIIKTNKQLSELGKFKSKITADSRINKDYYTAIKNKFSHGSNSAKKVFNQLVPEMSVVDAEYEGIAYYSRKSKKIHMHYGADLINMRGTGATWYHEHGHMIDDLAGGLSSNPDFDKLLRDDYLVYMKTYGKKHGLKTFDQVQAAMSKDLSDMRRHSAVSDILQGLSKGHVQGVAGHSLDYWKDSDALVTEAFAHMFEAQFDAVRYAEMKKYFPNALRKFEEMLEAILK